MVIKSMAEIIGFSVKGTALNTLHAAVCQRVTAWIGRDLRFTNLRSLLGHPWICVTQLVLSRSEMTDSEVLCHTYSFQELIFETLSSLTECFPWKPVATLTPITVKDPDHFVLPSVPREVDLRSPSYILRKCATTQNPAWSLTCSRERYLLATTLMSATVQTVTGRIPYSKFYFGVYHEVLGSNSVRVSGGLISRMNESFTGILSRHGRLTFFYRTYSRNSGKTSQQALFRSKTAYYDILEITPNATQAQIKTAYYKQSFVYHPDRNAGSEEAAQMFTQISEAYTVLGSISLRKKYDKGILSNSDLQTAGKPSGKVDFSVPQKKSTRVATRFSSGKPVFDFDQFYKSHYGEQLERERMLRWRKEQRQKKQNLDEQWEPSRLLEVALAVLFFSAMALVFSLSDKK